jgi:hypothetical protein
LGKARRPRPTIVQIKEEEMNSKRSWIPIALFAVVLLAACGGGEASDLSQAAPGDKIVLSESVRLDGLPYAVIPYDTTPALALTSLQLEKAGDWLQGKVEYTRKGQDDFALVIHCTAPEQLLIGYLDPDTNLTLSLPSGGVLFGTRGYKLSGGESGTIEFALQYRQTGMYSLAGKTTVSVFAVPGTVNPRSILPGEQTDPAVFQSNSNVLQSEVDF